MSVEQNKANEKRLYDEVYNKGNLSLIPELVSPDFVSGDSKGHEGYRQIVNTWRAAMPDLHFTIDEMVGEGDRLVYRLSGTGTGAGKLAGIDITGKKMSWTQAIFTEYKDGKVSKGVNIQDALTLYQQAGITPPAFTQTQEANKATLRRYYEEVLNNGNYSLWSELMTDDYVLRAPGGELKGAEAGKQNYAQRKAMAPDSQFTIDEIVGEGDTVVVRGMLKGTHTGEFQGNPPTGKEFARAYTAFYRFRGGKIAEGWTVQDVLGFYQQLGITPPGPADVNKAAIRRTMEEIWNRGDVSRIPELVTSDYIAHQAGGQQVKGQDGFGNMVATARAGFPDLQCRIDELVAEGDNVVCRFTMSGTQLGEYNGMPPTGNKLSYQAMYVTRMKDGKSAETWAFSDQTTAQQQLGTMPQRQ
jgi:steroid delta-isomerase-like uncharacterized protein